MKNIPLWFIARSISLDFALMKLEVWNPFDKLCFILKKYSLFIYHLFFGFELGISHIVIQGKTLYYDSSLGLASYQSLLVRTAYLLALEDVSLNNVIDVGANVGQFSLAVHQLSPTSKIIAIEPIPQIFQVMKKNISQISNIILLNTAIGDSAGKLKMSFSSQDSPISKIDTHGEVDVEVATLDAITKNIELIDLLKIDVNPMRSMC